MTRILIATGLFLTLLTAAGAQAEGFESLDRIDTLVATTTGAGIGQPGGAVAPVDRRLKLAACPQAPLVEGPVFGAAVVRCERIGWRIRVPLVPLQPATTAFQRPHAPVTRSILIRKGDPVQLVAGNASFTVSRLMMADEDGAVGELIRVREDRQSAPVSGRVEPDGSVRVPGI